MKRKLFIISLIIALYFNFSCREDDSINPGFEDMIQMSILDYVVDSTDNFTSFKSILEKGGVDKTISAYNPDAEGYTLFLPTNDAIDRYIQNSDQFSSLNDLLNNQDFVNQFSRYHIVNKAIESNEFPFGAFADKTLSEDYLTVSFVIEEDTSYYKINNQAPVIKKDIEASNGFIHVIDEALQPITYTTYGWINLHDGFSIFNAAVELTGFNSKLDINLKDKDIVQQPITLLLEHDTAYQSAGINSVDDLIELVSPNNNDYTNDINPLYNYVGYHVLTGNYYLDDFDGNATNYSTMSDIPLNINGVGIEIKINRGKQVFDTIVNGVDTTFIDFIGFDYDNSNVLTQSGAIHFINRMMTQQSPSRALKTYEFQEELYLVDLKEEVGSYLIEDQLSLARVDWEGADLFFVQENEDSPQWSQDYLQIDGDFTMSYTIPKIVQGKYTVYMSAEAFNEDNALVELFIDGKKIGGLIDLSYGGTSGNPFAEIELGTVDFIKYSEHLIEVKTLIPGRFLWDYIQFEPY